MTARTVCRDPTVMARPQLAIQGRPLTQVPWGERLASRVPPPDAGVEHYHLGALADNVSVALSYSSADLVVVPTVEKNSPNIILESFVCGPPLVAFDAGGISELVLSPVLGGLVSEIGGRELAKAMESALATEFDAAVIGDHAEVHFRLSTHAAN